MSTILPFGTWPSIISAEELATAAPRFSGAAYVGSEIWWGEGIPSEGGRTAVFREGAAEPLLPAPWNARSRVHEYGGGAWTATVDRTLYFVESRDQRVWALPVDAAEPTPLTPEDDAERYGSLSVQNGRLIAVRERHTGAVVPERDIVAIPLGGSAAANASAIASLAAGSDFVAQPRLSPDGSRLAWIAWDHPSMPWDDAQLRVGKIGADGVTSWTVLSRAAATQAEWTSPTELVISDDPTGRWNLFTVAAEGPATASRALAPADADTGGPLWSLGTRWFDVLSDGRLVAVRTNGTDILVSITPDGVVTELPVPLTGGIEVADSRGQKVLVFGGSGSLPAGLWEIDVDSPAEARAIRGGSTAWDAAWLPVPRQLTFAGKHGDVYAFNYPPTNPLVSAPAGELAPYVLTAHGGPTGHESGLVSEKVAYFTSRGIGVLDVNYGGSTGYGRAYRERLRDNWGIVDIDDLLSAAEGLAAAGFADPTRLAIKGGSAGGLTVLGSLVRGGVFAAGISRYGVADLRSLATDTHDFEARYLDGLIGRYPEDEAIYVERSPLTHADKIQVPVLLLQGDQDPVVPPSQSEAVRDALLANGIPHHYELFAGESHGFRRRETIVAAAELELSFLGAAFGFTPEDLPPLTLS